MPNYKVIVYLEVCFISSCISLRFESFVTLQLQVKLINTFKKNYNKIITISKINQALDPYLLQTTNPLIARPLSGSPGTELCLIWAKAFPLLIKLMSHI